MFRIATFLERFLEDHGSVYLLVLLDDTAQLREALQQLVLGGRFGRVKQGPSAGSPGAGKKVT